MVDDHEVVRAGLRAQLGRSETVEVVGEAGDAAGAIKEALRLTPDVVLLDFRLPDESGLHACREILASVPGVRVLFLTSYPDREAVTSTILAGASGYLLKEVDDSSLVNAIEAVAAGLAILDPAVTQSVLAQIKALALDDGHDGGAGLTEQERRVLELVVEGKTNKEIARALGLSDKTVKNYLSHAFQKMKVSRRSQAAALFARRRRPPG